MNTLRLWRLQSLLRYHHDHGVMSAVVFTPAGGRFVGLSCPHDRTLRTMQRRLEKAELEHLRQHALELHERVEQLEAQLRYAEDCAEMWQRDAMNLQEALDNENFATHRCIGLSRSGELMVVRNEQGSATREHH